MKVLFINSDYGSGSTGRIVRDLKLELERQGNECLALYGRENCCNDQNVNRIGDKFSVYGHVAMTRFADRQGFASTSATRKALKQIDAFQPDIIHLHNLHGSYLDCKVLFDYLKTENIPILWTLHDCWSFTGHCSNYSAVGCNKWKTGCYGCPQTREYPKSFFDNSKNNYSKKEYCFNHCRNLQITTVSKWLKDEVKQSYLKKYPVSIVPNGVDLDTFQPGAASAMRKRLKVEGKRVLISVASVWGPRKGLKLLLELAQRMGDEYRLIIVGIDLAQDTLPPNVIAVRRTDSIEELADLYRAADVFVNASVEETFGMVSLEALACGKPVVTNSFTANPELINDSCGVLVSDYSVDGYIKAIVDTGVWNMREEDCRKRAEQYSHKRMINGYISLYRSMI